MPYKCFWTERTDRLQRYLRRYATAEDCPAKACGAQCHDASVRIEDGVGVFDSEGYLQTIERPDKSDPRWLTHCACGYEFKDSDPWQVFHEIIYVDAGGNEYTTRHAPVGMMWNAYWRRSIHASTDDGLIVTIQTPGGEWCIDSVANNCTRPDDRIHHCWVRHGDPRTGNIHVDKTGNTCSAGAGSILCNSYHGFLHNGSLTDHC